MYILRYIEISIISTLERKCLKRYKIFEMKFPNVNYLSCQNLIASNKRNALAAITQRNILQLVTFCPCFKTFSSSKLLFCCKVVFIKIMMTIYLYTFVCATDA